MVSTMGCTQPSTPTTRPPLQYIRTAAIKVNLVATPLESQVPFSRARPFGLPGSLRSAHHLFEKSRKPQSPPPPLHKQQAVAADLQPWRRPTKTHSRPTPPLTRRATR